IKVSLSTRATRQAPVGAAQAAINAGRLRTRSFCWHGANVAGAIRGLRRSYRAPSSAARSATAHRDDDFELVAIGEFHLGVTGLGDDLAVALDGEALADEAARLEQGEHGEI